MDAVNVKGKKTKQAETLKLSYKKQRRRLLPANKGHSPNVVSMLGQRRRRWPDIKTTLSECPVFAGLPVGPWSSVAGSTPSSCFLLHGIILNRSGNRDRCWPGWRRLKDGKKSVMLARHSVVVRSMPSSEVYSINQHQQPRVSAMGGKKGGPKVYWISNRRQNPKQLVVGVVVVHTTGRHL